MDDPPVLPEPILALPLPSIHDHTLLDCRIYLPSTIVDRIRTEPPPSRDDTAMWRGHAAVVAHPYAPMGGSYDDPIVKMLAAHLLAHGQCVVATFNFRGAVASNGRSARSSRHKKATAGSGHGSSGSNHASWTAKAEIADYMTVVGFLSYFVHELDPYGWKVETAIPPATLAAHATPATPTPLPTPSPVLIAAGYSYGALVTTLLPPLDTILQHFVRPLRGSPAADVRQRAVRWAAMTNADLRALREAVAESGTPASLDTTRRSEARVSMGVRVGGAESSSHNYSHSLGRHSHEAGNGLHHVPGWVVRVRRHADSAQNGTTDDDKTHLPAVPDWVPPREAYLLVSPPMGLTASLVTLSWGLFGAQATTAAAVPPTESKMKANPTLLVYGSADGFVPIKRARQWAARMTAASQQASGAQPQKSRFRAHEVAAADHFWREGRSQYELEAEAVAFIEAVTHDMDDAS